MSTFQKLSQSPLAHCASAFFIMGSWSLFANWGHPMPKPIIAAVTQGVLSALITFGLKTMLETLSERLPGLLALIVPPLVAFGLSVTILTLVHTLAGTPEIQTTIAVPVTVATLYSASYTYSLWKKDGSSHVGD